MAIAEIAVSQHGLITLGQLRERGVSERMIRGRCRLGTLHRVHRQVYAAGHPPATREARWMAAVLACGPGALLSHGAAAVLWGIRDSRPSRIDVSSLNRCGYTTEAIALHRAGTLEGEDRAVRLDIPVTSLPRTIVDLAAVVLPAALEYAIHRAEAKRLITPAEIERALLRLGGRRGSAAVAAIVRAPHHALEARCRTRQERRLLRICRA